MIIDRNAGFQLTIDVKYETQSRANWGSCHIEKKKNYPEFFQSISKTSFIGEAFKKVSLGFTN